jgi:ribosome-associated translation inhibitor RaiA
MSKVKVYNAVIAGKADSNDMYASLEKAIDKVKTQLKKHKGKLKEKRPEKIEETVSKATKPKTNDDEVDV